MQEKAFKEIKRTISRETLLVFPDFNKTFHVYTDASDYQLGGVIVQDNKPLAFYSRKLTDTQKKYTTGEQELLSIVETLKEFRTLLLGQQLIVHTDHKNILYGSLANDRITRWRLIIEEFCPEIVHVSGQDNTVADALSRLNMEVEEEKPTIKVCACAMANMGRNESIDIPEGDDAAEMAEIFATTKTSEEAFPMAPALIAREQKKDKELEKMHKGTRDFQEMVIEDTSVITYKNQIYVPKTLRQKIVAWYHLYLRHPGSTRMEATLRQLYWWPSLRNDVEKYVKTCRECQMCKKTRKKYGHIPPKDLEKQEPWNRVNVDLIGPLTVRAPNGTFELNALTMIDPATGWFEIAEVSERTAECVAAAFDDVWLTRYPRPQYIGFDNGGENKALFRDMVRNYGMKSKPTTTHNPTANGIVERVHAVLNDALRTFELEDRELDKKEPFREFLSATAFAIRATYHTVLECTPAQLVFGRDMILPVAIHANWERIRAQRLNAITKNNKRENKKRIPYTYEVGDKVLYNKHGKLRKLSTPRRGPYTVAAVHDNGTLTIRLGAVSERINIRHITPYFERNEETM